MVRLKVRWPTCSPGSGLVQGWIQPAPVENQYRVSGGLICSGNELVGFLCPLPDCEVGFGTRAGGETSKGEVRGCLGSGFWLRPIPVGLGKAGSTPRPRSHSRAHPAASQWDELRAVSKTGSFLGEEVRCSSWSSPGFAPTDRTRHHPFPFAPCIYGAPKFFCRWGHPV